MTTHPSFFDYDKRDSTDPVIQTLNKKERFTFSAKLVMWLFIIVGILTIIHLTAFGAETTVTKRVIQDDAYICTHINEYPVEQHKAILDYCVGLMNRGL